MQAEDAGVVAFVAAYAVVVILMVAYVVSAFLRKKK